MAERALMAGIGRKHGVDAWSVVSGCFIGVSVTIAPAYMTVLGLFMKPMSAATGLSRGELSMVPSLMALVAAVCSPFVGGLIDRRGARFFVLVGVVMLPLGLVAHAWLTGSLPFLLAIALFMGIAAPAASPLPFVSALPQWFDRRLGLSIAVAMSGIGFGEIVLPKIAAALIDAAGWRLAWIEFAGIVFVIGLVNALTLFRENPAHAARRTGVQAVGDRPPVGMTAREAVRSPTFWLLGLAVCLIAQVGVGMIIHAVPMLTDRGVGLERATNAIAILGVGSLLGRLTTGFLLDRLSIALVGGTLFALQSLGVLVLWLGVGGAAPFVAILVVGLAVGAETDIIPFAVRRKFGLRQFGRIFGMIYGLFSVGPVLGPLFMGLSFDRTGSYSSALLGFVMSAAMAAVAMALVGGVPDVVDGEAVAA